MEYLARVSWRNERGLPPPDRPDSLVIPSAPAGGDREVLASTIQPLLHQASRIWYPHHRSWDGVRVRVRCSAGGLEEDRLRFRVGGGSWEYRPAPLARVGRPGAGVATIGQFE